MALTPFDGMCGFRPAAEISTFCATVPELRAVVGDKACDALASAVAAGAPDAELRSCLRQCFAGLMTRDDAAIAKQLETLGARLGQVELSTPTRLCSVQ